MENPLLEAGAYQSGHRIAFRHQGTAARADRGQFMFDFSSEENRVVTSPPRTGAGTGGYRRCRLVCARDQLEEDPSTQSEAITAYLKVLEMDPIHAAAHINLGTLYYNRQEYALAERHYRSAIQIDPRYALAYFDLGNVLDETGRVEEAINTYKTAIQLAPTYADAHYNIALAYEKIREPRKALQHWRAYVKLDTTGPWTVHAKHQIQRILQGDSLKLVSVAVRAANRPRTPTLGAQAQKPLINVGPWYESTIFHLRFTKIPLDRLSFSGPGNSAEKQFARGWKA